MKTDLLTSELLNNPSKEADTLYEQTLSCPTLLTNMHHLILVLEYLDILITPITSIINASLEQGKCPNFFKQAHVTPILKKSSLDKKVFKNYRPISNLNFISKILERVVALQLQTHLDEASLMTVFQSA